MTTLPAACCPLPLGPARPACTFSDTARWGVGGCADRGLSGLCPQIQHTEDMENDMDELLQEFEEKSGRAFLHTVCFY